MMTPDAETVVRGFLADVRSGDHPDRADRYFAPSVTAHQVVSEGEFVVMRSPENYAEHIREFLTLYGRFQFQVTELIASGDRVYVRWRQTGRHLQSVAGEPPSGQPLIDVSSAVYRVEDGRIVEYWIQSDRAGMDLQLAAIARSAA